VTGASRGIGLAICESLIAEGWGVVGASKSGLVAEGVKSFQVDLADLNSLAANLTKQLEELGPVDCLIANAGITYDMLLMRSDVALMRELIDVNLTSTLIIAKEVLKGMIKNRWGRIVLIGSVVGMSGSGGQVAYSASKSALIGATRSLAREVGSRGITVNLIAPGYIDTDMTAGFSQAQREDVIALTPSGRIGTPTDVANAVRFLVSDEASFINGAVIPVDGGLGMGN
jgi:NAD(P)-dependent dehydrogenase (short-subunit alcohol dehydrogenase family)